jgi:hypothetical protein
MPFTAPRPPCLQPAFIFSATHTQGVRYTQEAVSHEFGHQLGLSHDSTRTLAYYPGHGSWGPIMGVRWGCAGGSRVGWQ